MDTTGGENKKNGGPLTFQGKVKQGRCVQPAN